MAKTKFGKYFLTDAPHDGTKEAADYARFASSTFTAYNDFSKPMEIHALQETHGPQVAHRLASSIASRSVRPPERHAGGAGDDVKDDNESVQHYP